MTIFVDLVGSWIVRASMIAVMLGLIVTLNDTVYQSTQAMNARGQVAVIDSIIYADVNDAGYNVSGTSFQVADSTNMQFLGDINGGGVPETIHYYTSLNSDTTYNLYRYVNNVNSGTPLLVGSHLKSVTFHYYDKSGSQTSTLSSIKQIRVTVVTTTVADIRVYPPNLL